MTKEPSIRKTPATARALAWAVLDEHRHNAALVTDIFERWSRRSNLGEKDRRLAAEITFGVVRRRRTLDGLIRKQLRRRAENVEARLWTLLQVGVYQLVFSRSVPKHAAVDETVKLARWLGKPRWTGFANGILRGVGRCLTDTFSENPASDAIPISEDCYRKCGTSVFPDPFDNPAGYLAAAFSFPDWMVQRWIGRFDFEELLRLGHWFNTPGRLSLRINRLKTTQDEMLTRLREAGIACQAGDHPQAVRLQQTVSPTTLPGFQEGLFTVQDESAMMAAELLAPEPGSRVLDMCAAPGTKTTHLAEMMRNEGTILATDIDAARLRLVEENRDRLGCSIIETRLIRSDGSDLPEGPFDAALLDVPCSNTGVLGKRPEARWRIKPHDIHELAALQQRLLRQASERIRPGGRILYSTCSIEPEENDQLVDAVLQEQPGWALLRQIAWLPGQPGDGGFQALLQRESSFDNANVASRGEAAD